MNTAGLNLIHAHSQLQRITAVKRLQSSCLCLLPLKGWGWRGGGDVQALSLCTLEGLGF